MSSLGEKKKRKVAEIAVALGIIETAVGYAATEHEICGSIRRGCEEVGDIDVVVDGPMKVVVYEIARSCIAAKVKFECLSNLEKSEKTVNLIVDSVQVDLYLATKENWGAMTLFLTGDPGFNIAIRASAKSQQLKLNQYGLWRGDDLLAAKTEEQIFDCIGLRYVEPQNRNAGALIWADSGKSVWERR